MELQTVEFYDEMDRVVQAMLKGTTNATALARELDMPRKKVLEYMDLWAKASADNPYIKERAQQTLAQVDKHYDLIIKEMWNIVNTSDDDKVRAGVLKNLADVEAKRNEILTKAGLFDDSDIADQLVEYEEQVEKIKSLFADVVRKYPETKLFIMEALREVFGQSPTMPAQGPTIAGELTNV